jgi:hypothetical protein
MDSSSPDIRPHERGTDRCRARTRHGSTPVMPSRRRNLTCLFMLALLASPSAPSALAERMPLPEPSAVISIIERDMVAPARDALPSAQEPSGLPESSAPSSAAAERVTNHLRWWLALALTGLGIMLLVLAWSIFRGRRIRRARRHRAAEPDPAREYFPDCSLVDLHVSTGRPAHRLSAKYNMITRLQEPAEDHINYIRVFRRQISRRHALIEYRDFSFWITDQNSLNGTFVNDQRIHAETRLKHGDRIRFHTHAFEFCASDLVMSNETLVGRRLATVQ